MKEHIAILTAGPAAFALLFLSACDTVVVPPTTQTTTTETTTFRAAPVAIAPENTSTIETTRVDASDGTTETRTYVDRPRPY